MSDLSQSQQQSNSANQTKNGADTSDAESFTLFGSERELSRHAEFRKTPSRPFKPRQFMFGLALSTGGMGLMLFVAAGTLHDAGAGGAVSLPATGLCMILGLMLLGGGFGQMAISSPSFDDSEFQRMLNGDMEEDDSKEDGSENSDATGILNHIVANSDQQENMIDDISGSSLQTRPIESPSSDTQKRLKSEPRDSFVSTVMSDVVASQG